jgi:hypothetical protein
MGKTVYILGAGFSKPAGFPKQVDLLPDLLNRIIDFEQLSSPDQFIPFDFSGPILEFLTKSGFVKNDELVFAITLEDLFTLLDQAITSRNTFVGYNWVDLIKIRDCLIRGVLGLLHGCAHKHIPGSEQRYKLFAANLISKRIKARVEDPKEDPFAIISLNWDSLVEDSLFWVLDQAGGIRNGRALADVDYCVYTTPLPNSPHTPSTKQKASGTYNIKLLKMHGSSTWLRCPCSDLVYTGLGMKEPAYNIYVKQCFSPFIKEHLDEREKESPAVLEPYIITPTFSKVFDLPHIQTTWHNAFLELREADEVVFIGYSLPDADYHFRALLRRAILSTTPIKVILHESDKPPENPSADSRAVYPAQRYRQVFNEEKLTFDYDGVEGFAKSFASEEQLPAAIEQIKGRFLIDN